MRVFTSFFMAAVILLSLSGQAQAFEDVKAGQWYGDVITQAVNLNLIQGYPDGCFYPNQPISYAQYASKGAIKTTADYGANVFRVAMYTAENGYIAPNPLP